MVNTKLNSADIVFTDLKYTVTISKTRGTKDILKSISGNFKSGELTAIMGPSGAGKSSLLNILTGFKKDGVKGQINIGSTIKKNRDVCSYILQEDNFFPWFTVEESMIMAATLKISSKAMDFKQRQILIENILENLHLNHAKQTKCSKLSGGQKKRLSIALELLDNPPVLFLDEPTTGLDSSSSADCIRLLYDLSKEGRTIVCTIHQPSASMYHMFNHIYILAEGQCVFQGDPHNTVPFLKSIGLNCPKYHNPADYLFEALSSEYGNHINSLFKAGKSDKWRYNQMKVATTENNESLEIANERKSVDQSNHIYPPPEWFRLWILIGRCHLQFYRDWTVTHLKFILHIFTAILMGIFYVDSGTNATKVIDNVGLCMISIVYLWYTTMMPGILKFPSEISTLKKETFNNWYKLRTYYIATLITSTPIHILFSTTFTTIVYTMTDQPLELERYVKFALTIIIITITADALGVFLGTLLNPVNGTFVGAISACTLLLFSGYIVFIQHMPKLLQFVSYASVQKYAFENLVVSIYDEKRSDMICPESEMYCHMKKATMILHTLGFTPHNYNFNVLMILLQIAIFRTLGYLTLRRALRKA